MAKHRSSDWDLAVLGHSIPENEFYELDPSTNGVLTGDATVAIGYPGFGPGDKVNVRPGDVTSPPIKGGIQKVEVQKILTPGMSGGPLLNSNGQVIGVIHKGGAEEERQLAIDISVLHKWLPQKDALLDMNPDARPAHAEPINVLEKVVAGPFHAS